MSATLNNTLRVQRAIHRLTQAELAERIGASRKSINAIETGNMVPSVLLALRLAHALAVPVETLFQLAPEQGELAPEQDEVAPG